MSRPSLALACIAKNELHNFPKLFESIRGCFDEIHITDTGSTDGSIEYLTDLVKSGKDTEVLGCPLKLHFFEWIQDFAAARNFSFSHVKTDFVMWMDLDDSLSDAQAFIHWRNTAMGLADYWLATYHYAFDDNGQPICSFARERVLRVKKGPKWDYFVHEGIRPGPGWTPQYAITWQVLHRRSAHDINKDKGRNLAIFEKNKGRLDSRMTFYYGKELFEAGKPMDAFPVLMEAITRADLEIHDRILGIQYAVYAALACNQLGRAIEIAHQGLQLDANRAEFYAAIGDAYSRQGKLKEAQPFFHAARGCQNNAPSNGKYHGAIYNQADAYGKFPTESLARIYYGTFNLDQAEIMAKEGVEKYNSEICRHILGEIAKATAVTSPDKSKLIKTDEIVITTSPEGAYPWDSEVYKNKGLGGSETAAVEVSQWLAKKSGLKVIVFNPRQNTFVDDAGVEYRPVSGVLDYFSKYSPRAHIAWRHNTKITDAPTYLWCHDLVTPGVEQGLHADKIICLSEFHRDYNMAMHGVPKDKIVVSRNGVNPARFDGLRKKNPNKVVFPSSPDRGLDRAMLIMDKAREMNPALELHVYYGLDNLEKYGLGEMAKHLRQMMEARPWVKYYGNVDQKTLAKELMEAVVWLYPANFIESFCITVLESVLAGCFPLVRKIGALQNTVKPFADMGMAELVDANAETEEEHIFWARKLIQTIEAKKWERIQLEDFEIQQLSWESVAEEFMGFMGIEKPQKTVLKAINHFDEDDEFLDGIAAV